MALSKLSVDQLLQRLCQDYEGRGFVPILEADVVSYLYHLWISMSGSAGNIHLDTRVCAEPDKRFDFVIGEVDYVAGERPCIEKPELVIEVKAFPLGFTDQQHRVHYYHVIEDDIPKLARLKEPLDGRYLFLFDEDNYLKGFDIVGGGVQRLSRIVQVRDKLDSKIKIIHVKKAEKQLEWEYR